MEEDAASVSGSLECAELCAGRGVLCTNRSAHDVLNVRSWARRVCGLSPAVLTVYAYSALE